MSEFKEGDRVRIDLPGFLAHGCAGRLTSETGHGWGWVRLDGFEYSTYVPVSCLRAESTVNPAEFTTATGALRR